MTTRQRKTIQIAEQHHAEIAELQRLMSIRGLGAVEGLADDSVDLDVASITGTVVLAVRSLARQFAAAEQRKGRRP